MYFKKGKKMKSVNLRFILIFPFIGFLYSNQSSEIDFLKSIASYDVSKILMTKEFIAEDGPNTINRPEPIGYFGENFYRFFIHFSSVIKNQDNPYQYFVYGKTKLKNNINAFQGTIDIEKAAVYKESDFPDYQQGYISAKYVLFEDSKQTGSGKFQGNCKINFFIDKNNVFRYDCLAIIADGFSNNQFEGTWQSYKSDLIKKCNWGDFRIPDSRELDSGAGEFGVNDKYEQNGWQDYQSPWEETKNVHQTQWWKD